MPIYTVHVPEAAHDVVVQADDTVFVREGFSGRAFLFGVLYLVWHRLWTTALVWVLALVAILALRATMHLPPFVVVALVGLMHLYLGAEGPDLLRGGLARRGLALRDLVSAPDLGAAEVLFFGRSPATSAPFTPQARSAVVPKAWPSTTPAVIGLFPDEGAA